MQVPSAANRLFLAAVFAILLTGCKTLSWKKDAAAETVAAAETATEESHAAPSMKIPVGTIHHVDPAGGFVLIRSSRLLQIEPGTTISVHGDDGMPVASVEVSPARKGQFLTADILNGTPLVGQRTLMEYAPPAPGAPAPGDDDIQVLE
ncbi:MAG: hypothetical protein NWR21_11120 [Verrucomicrobiales bacterium]|nr:hypothetical protein [Verrucomicrobiales bacterium]MDP4793179.1 hypothetical protein [Verrucomicrobiales bacterium]MDP4939854.1 hypothetical protein [Verrucomicrobiales bacterium]MDP5005334.1 hypothetical protein [Verrucomicrobiales bacterium]